MNVQNTFRDSERRTSADEVFERLRADIVALRLIPGAKLSEVEVAKQSDVSRQPVREAFIRLSNMNLLLVRPQKATLVRKISVQDILNTRFIRTAIEVEVVRKACLTVDEEGLKRIKDNLKQQKRAANKRDSDRFHELDYEFHHLICAAADSEFAFAAIAENKSHVDRLCMLSLANKSGMLELYRDHSAIYDALEKRDEEGIVSMTRLHLSRLDETLDDARKNHPDYFED
ncbi:GntR family transcriptional regulator [Pelagibius sp. Alg239-R121]|uniref:GntR family transcriptional regulator n=1 Tax=Pelagibius sp. Alg239-R121 TaxID=2993448 RepID=UPI0024A66F20|nr:GntR family transcriptional regulator [Pelagibius sp. Alg239-R121]